MPRVRPANADDVRKAVVDVTHHLPRIENLYLLSCYVLSFDFKRPEFCEGIIQDGLKVFPNSWRLPLTQGLIEVDQLHNRASGAVYYAMAASRSDAPEFLKSYAAKLVNQSDLSPEEVTRSVDELFGRGASSQVSGILEESIKRRHATP